MKCENGKHVYDEIIMIFNFEHCTRTNTKLITHASTLKNLTHTSYTSLTLLAHTHNLTSEK